MLSYKKNIMKFSRFTVEFRPKKRCWRVCAECQKPWSEINTEFVSLARYLDGNLYVCDSCMEKHEMDQNR